MSFELRHLRAFVAVAEELNFTRAAERLHLAQQALSTQIRQLEERVGTVLVERTTRKVELTPAGKAFYDHAVGMLAAADAAAAAARAAVGERLRLNVGFTTPFDHEPMKLALAEFAERRPDVDVQITFADVLDTCGGARRPDVDVGVGAGPFDRTGLDCQMLWSEPLGLALAADHPLAAKETISVAEYVAEPIFDYPTPDLPAREFWMGPVTAAGGHRASSPVSTASTRCSRRPARASASASSASASSTRSARRRASSSGHSPTASGSRWRSPGPPATSATWSRTSSRRAARRSGSRRPRAPSAAIG